MVCHNNRWTMQVILCSGWGCAYTNSRQSLTALCAWLYVDGSTVVFLQAADP
jgi:hypothetical protein